MQLANLFELDAQPMAERAFGPQFFQQGLSFVEGVGGNILALEHVSKAALNFILGKQGDLPLSVPPSGAKQLEAAKQAIRRAANSPGTRPVISFLFYWLLPSVQ
jgi:hypothetical protein